MGMCTFRCSQRSSQLTMVQGTELRSLSRVASALNHWSDSPPLVLNVDTNVANGFLWDFAFKNKN